ncbi:MAG: prolyl oligopeptidase family serine peptidase [Planctomycetota bacterium]
MSITTPRRFTTLLGSLAVVLCAGSCFAQGQFNYPKAEKGSTTDTYFKTTVTDPYRWLEDDNSAATAAWVKAQNQVTTPYLESIPQRSAIRERLTQLWDYEKFSTPGREGGKFFYSYNEGLKNQGTLYVTDSLDKQGMVLIDPNTLRDDGTAALAGTAVSEDGKYIAYGISQAGSDWNSWKVRDVSTGKDLSDDLQWVKFSGADWMKDGSGIFYTRYDAPDKGKELTAANYYPKFTFHKIGDEQSKDTLVYQRPDQKEWGFGGGVTEDGQYLILSVSQGTDRKNRLFVRDLKTTPVGAAPTPIDAKIRAVELEIQGLVKQGEASGGSDAEKFADRIKTLRTTRAELVASQAGKAHGFLELLNEFDASYSYVGNNGTAIWFNTNLDAPKGRVIKIDLANPARDKWVTVVPEAAETLVGVGMVGDYMFANYLKDAKTQIKQFALDGKLVREVALPGIGTAGGFGGKRVDKDTFYSFNSYNVPPSIFRYDIATGKSTLWKSPKVPFDPSVYEVEQKFYKSKDGTKIPMFLAHKKGIKLDGNNATLLYGYGGFNIPLTPSFSPAIIGWMEMGGVYAVANIRGGGEYGEEWHQAGTKTKKQNVFDDFIAAAEFLISEKYTQPSKLGCSGGSNGGLLVGAMITQRPELWGACLPAVGVLDMLRFHKFTIGWAWKSDYGSSEDNADEFKALHAYSPYHVAMKTKGAKWPATLITTGDHDDRVVPAHSFKFAAALQETQTGDKPVLIRVDVRAGHGAGKPTAKKIDEVADQYSFLVKQLGVDVPKN